LARRSPHVGRVDVDGELVSSHDDEDDRSKRRQGRSSIHSFTQASSS